MEINQFRYFRGFNYNLREVQPVFTANLVPMEIGQQRLFVAQRIELEMPANSTRLISFIEDIAIERKAQPFTISTFVHSEHPSFMRLLGSFLEYEDSPIADALAFSYYGLRLVDIFQEGTWIWSTVQELNTLIAEEDLFI